VGSKEKQGLSIRLVPRAQSDLEIRSRVKAKKPFLLMAKRVFVLLVGDLTIGF